MNIFHSILSSPISTSFEGNHLNTQDFFQNAPLFLGFSHADILLQSLIEGNICNIKGEPHRIFSHSTFPLIASDHKMHSDFRGLINCVKSVDPTTQKEFRLSELLSYLNSYSSNFHTEEMKIGGSSQLIDWPKQILEIEIIGSIIWKLLFDNPDILSNAVNEIFGEYVTANIREKLITILLQNLDESQQDSNKKDIDSRIICDERATIYHLARLSSLVREICQSDFPDSAAGLLKKFAIVNTPLDTFTIVGLDFDQNPLDLVFTKKRKSTCTINSLYISFKHLLENSSQPLAIECAGSAAEILIASACKIYNPTDISNPQSWVRLLYEKSDFSCPSESEMVNCLIAPFRRVSHNDNLYNVLIKLGYKSHQINFMFDRTGDCNNEEEAIIKLLYILVSQKFFTKDTLSLNEITNENADKNFGFLWRCCQSLQTYSNFSNYAVARIWALMKNDYLKISEENTSFLYYLSEAITTHSVPFSVLCSLMTIKTYLQEPYTFTQRQNPVFLTKIPFSMRVLPNLEQAHIDLKMYLESDRCNLEILEKIITHFPIVNPVSSFFYEKICHELNFNVEELEQHFSFLFTHSSHALNSLGLSLKLIKPNNKTYLELLRKLPRLIEANQITALTDLRYKLCAFYQIKFEHQDISSIAEWVIVLLESNNALLIKLAYEFYKSNAYFFNIPFIPYLLNTLSRVDFNLAMSALKLSIDKFNIDPFSTLVLLQNIFLHARNQKYQGNFNQLYTIVEAALKQDQYNFQDKKLQLFPAAFAYFLETVENKEVKKYFLLLGFFQGVVSVNQIVTSISPDLHPLLPFLSWLTKEEISLSLEKKNKLFDLFHPVNQQISLDEKIAWTNIVCAANYPEEYVEQGSTDLMVDLQRINQYCSSPNCCMDELVQIGLSLQRSGQRANGVNICQSLNIEEGRFIEELNSLITHAEIKANFPTLKSDFGVVNSKFYLSILSQLPQLLEKSQTERENLSYTFNSLANTYKISVENLSPDCLSDWLKLLAQTKEKELLNLALAIRKSHPKAAPADLMIFAGLSYTDPSQALTYLYDLLLNEQKFLSATQLLNALKRLKQAYRSAKIDLYKQREFSLIIETLLNQKISFGGKQKQEISSLLVSYFENQKMNEKSSQLLLQATLQEVIPLNFLSNQCAENILFTDSNAFSIKNRKIFQKICLDIALDLFDKNNQNYFRFLDRLLAEEIFEELAPAFYSFAEKCLDKDLLNPTNLERLNKLFSKNFAKETTLSYLINKILNRLYENNLGSLSDCCLKEIDQLLGNFISKNSTDEWRNKLLCYLNHFAITQTRFPNVINILIKILQPTHFSNPSVINLLSKLIETDLDQTHSNDNLLRLITPLQTEIVQPLNESFNLQEACFYLSYFHKNNLRVNLLVDTSWKICVQLSQKGDSINCLLHYFLMQTENSWKAYFDKVKKIDVFRQDLKSLLDLFVNCESIESKRAQSMFFFLMNYYLTNISIDLILDCSDDKFLNLLSLSSFKDLSLITKKYLFFSRDLTATNIKELVQLELDREYSIQPPNTAYCFDLTQRYFPTSLLHRKLFLKNNPQIKENKLVEAIFEDLNRIDINAHNHYLLMICFCLFFQILRHSHSDKTWDLMEQEIKVLNLYPESLESVSFLILEGAALNLQDKFQCLNKSKKSHGSKKILKNIEIKRKILLDKLDQIRFIPINLLMITISSFDSNFILGNLEKCFELTVKCMSSNSEIDKSFIQSKEYYRKFSTNINFLIKNVCSKKDEKQLNQVYQLIKYGIVDIHLTSEILIELLDFYESKIPQHTIIDFCHIEIFQYYFNIYELLMNNFEVDAGRIKKAFHLFDLISLNYSTILNLEKNTSETQKFAPQLLNFKALLFSSLNQIKNQIFPKKIETKVNYLETIIEAMKNISNPVCGNFIILNLFPALEAVGKKNINYHNKLKKKFPEIIQFEIARLYMSGLVQKSEINFYREWTINLLTSTQRAGFYNDKQEFLKFFQIIDPDKNRFETLKISVEDARKVNLEAVKLLLEMGTNSSFIACTEAFIKLIISNPSIPLMEKSLLFDNLWENAVKKILATHGDFSLLEDSMALIFLDYLITSSRLDRNCIELNQNEEMAERYHFTCSTFLSLLNPLLDICKQESESNLRATNSHRRMITCIEQGLEVILKSLSFTYTDNSPVQNESFWLEYLEKFKFYILNLQSSQLNEEHSNRVAKKILEKYTLTLLKVIDVFYLNDENIPEINFSPLIDWITVLIQLKHQDEVFDHIFLMLLKIIKIQNTSSCKSQSYEKNYKNIVSCLHFFKSLQMSNSQLGLYKALNLELYQTELDSTQFVNSFEECFNLLAQLDYTDQNRIVITDILSGKISIVSQMPILPNYKSAYTKLLKIYLNFYEELQGKSEAEEFVKDCITQIKNIAYFMRKSNLLLSTDEVYENVKLVLGEENDNNDLNDSVFI